METRFQIRDTGVKAAGGQFESRSAAASSQGRADAGSPKFEPIPASQPASQKSAGLVSGSPASRPAEPLTELSLLRVSLDLARARSEQLRLEAQLAELQRDTKARSRTARRKLGIRYAMPYTLRTIERDEHVGLTRVSALRGAHKGKTHFGGPKGRYGQRMRSGSARIAKLFEEVR
jgi:hypothetical protein